MKAEMMTKTTCRESVQDMKNAWELGMRKTQGFGMLAIIMFMFALIGSVGSGLLSEAQASEEEVQVTQEAKVYLKGLSYFSGVVTANQGNAIQIDHNNYSLHKKLTVQDEEGRERKLQELIEGVEVHFHVKQGKVDQLILRLAR